MKAGTETLDFKGTYVGTASLFHSSSVSRHTGSKVTPLILSEVPQFEALSQDSGHTMSGSINKGPNACTPGGPPMRFPRDVSPSKMGCKLGVPKK